MPESHMYVVTLLANPQKRNLTRDFIADTALACGSENMEILMEGVAAKIISEREIYSESAAKLGIDIIHRKLPKAKIKLLVCDMESTIIDNEFLDEMADVKGIKDQVADITARAMNGQLNFEEAMRERVALLRGMPENEVRDLIKTRLKYNQGAHELLKWCKANGVYTMLVSGGFTMFTEVVAKELGFDEHHANTLVFKDGKLDSVADPILGKEAKLAFLKAKAEELKIPLSQTATMGDGANDLPMLKAAGVGIAYKAKPLVKSEIKIQINYSDLECIRFFF
jgi:phosphoserine phosphatase